MSNFTWVPIYKELSDVVLKDKNNDGKTILDALIKSFQATGNSLSVSSFKGIDPFTFFACFNGYISANDKRISLLTELKTKLNLKAAVPIDFDGIPKAGNPQKIWFAGGDDAERNNRKILWDLFENAINYSDNKLSSNEFEKNFDLAVDLPNVKWRLTTILFLIRSNTFISLDDNSRKKLLNDYGIDVSLKGKEYLDLCNNAQLLLKDFKIFSLDAWNSNSTNSNNTNIVATSIDSTTANRLFKYENKLYKVHNLIFRGAPGTGKTYFAKQLAAYVVSNKEKYDYEALDKEEKKQIEFVQFHPSYDYTDFVEGIRPKDDGDFKLESGTFKRFIEQIDTSYGDSTVATNGVEINKHYEKVFDEILTELENNGDELNTKNGSKFVIVGHTEKIVYINANISKEKDKNDYREITVSARIIKNMLNDDKKYSGPIDITLYYRDGKPDQRSSYEYAIYDKINDDYKQKIENKINVNTIKNENEKKYVFIIDEINRGEISKIFGELFFSVDPGYRGEKGKVSTQYSNMHEDPLEKFYVPKNVYIIGTMNDIDRSVDTFDFAMRRRFAFVPITVEDSQIMLSNTKIRNRMNNLNSQIIQIEGLNENYQIGASYFRRLEMNELDDEELWDYYLKPLLEDYMQGIDGVKDKIEVLYQAYKNDNSVVNVKQNNDSKNTLITNADDVDKI